MTETLEMKNPVSVQQVMNLPAIIGQDTDRETTREPRMERWLTINQVVSLSTFSRRTIYRKAASDPTFPKIHKVSDNRSVIKASEWFQWMRDQEESGRDVPDCAH